MARRDRFHGRRRDLPPRICDHPGCDQPGEFRAPKSRSGGPEGYYLFCLDHVRAYNERWDYFKGMSRAQVEAAAWSAYTWERPTYPRNGHGPVPDVDDVLNLFGDQPGFGRRFTEEGRRGAGGRRLSATDLDALETLGLDADATDQDIRDQYRRLVRAYHPDTNQGDRAAEGKLVAVIAAYRHLYNSSAA